MSLTTCSSLFINIFNSFYLPYSILIIGEIFYKSNPKYWSKGYATEVSKKIIDDIFDHVIYIVECCIEEINSSESKMVGAKIVVEYDDSLYYPTKITCTGYYPEDYYGGLSESITISDFEIK